ncbi:hypothetical protein [Parageobacillus galactosidasius]|uniref:Uncharacterized protein n=1 Tax=Parageobacillus galactosidasius TaxID=883812 RepID=A0A226QQE0_9BACL|nr:hypothetical protein [Parageobacillus galactosidasius]OXB94691.1 hypothetical protein B9L23_07435 [Parageobacillus galactosidasius]
MELIGAYLQKRRTNITNHPLPFILITTISTLTDISDPKINIKVLTLIKDIEIRRRLDYIHPIGHINFGDECRVIMTITFQTASDMYTFWDHFREKPFIINNDCFTGKARVLALSNFIETEEGIDVKLEVAMEEITLKNRNIASFL